jgi:acetolactate synthase-1/2/3 large subunit
MKDLLPILADALVAEDVRAVFGVPGSGPSLQLITLLESRGVPFYGTAHEAAGAVMAGAFGRQSGSLGCSVSIKGPGLANMAPGMLTNLYEQLPALSVSEAYGADAPASRMHKRLDHQAATAWCAKAYATLGAPRDTVARLAATAREEVPGPVHLDLATSREPLFIRRGLRGSANGSAARDWDGLLSMLERSRRPLVIAGGLADRRGWGAKLSALRVPVMTTVMAKGLVDETLPHAAGVYTGEGQALSPEAQIVPQADLVIGLGLRNLEVLTPKPFGAPLVLVDSIGGSLAGGFEPLKTCSFGAEQDTEALWARLAERAWGADLVGESTRRVRERLLSGEWLPGPLFAQLEDALPGIGCFVTDTGLFCTVAEHVWRVRPRQRFFASSNGRSMGTALPMAIGAALANRTSPTVCAAGDGGIGMYAAELKLAIDARLPLLILFLTDGRYASVSSAPQARGLSRKATTIPRPSWYRAVDALGCPADQVKDAGAFRASVREWSWKDGPRFIEAVFDPDRYASMTEGLR